MCLNVIHLNMIVYSFEVTTFNCDILLPEVRSHQLPLFGHFCCRLAAQPDCVAGEVVGGPLRVGQQPVWAQLRAFTLQLWHDRDTWLSGSPCLQSIVVDRVNFLMLLKLGHLALLKSCGQGFNLKRR